MTDHTPNAVLRGLWPLLFVQDMERSLAFYRDQLGFALARQATAKGKIFWCRMERGAVSIMLQQAEREEGDAEGRGRGVVFYFICDDADVMFAELTSRGLRLDAPKVAYYGMKQIVVSEPDGYSLCFESDAKSEKVTP